VASRRLREVVPVLQLDRDVAAKLGRRLRKITERLGVVREFDVLLAIIDKLTDRRRYPEGALRRVAAGIAEHRGHARQRLLAKVPVDDLHRVVAKLQKVARSLESEDAGLPARGTPPRSWRWAIDARIARRASTLNTAMSQAGGIYFAERLHEVRVAVKKLRYALELSAEIAGLKSTPDLRQLRRVQDILGRLHDLEMLIDRARQAQASLTPPNVTAWRELDVLIAALEDDCRRLHGRYMSERDAAAALCARLAGRASEIKNQKAR
jgi:CHAD domain-containing protein